MKSILHIIILLIITIHCVLLPLYSETGTIKQFYNAIETGNIAKVKELALTRDLLNYSADTPPLIYAVQESAGNNFSSAEKQQVILQIVELLLTMGADPNCINENGETALYKAVINEKISVNMVRLLLNKGSLIPSDSSNPAAYKYLNECIENGQYYDKHVLPKVRLLLSKIPVTSLTTDQQSNLLSSAIYNTRTYDLVQFLLAKGITPLGKDYQGNSTLHEAVTQGSFDICTLLLKYGVSINSKNNDGATPLHYLLLQSDYNLDVNLKLQFISFLAGKGADINSTDNEGKTPLHYGIIYSNSYSLKELENIITTLLDNGAKINTPDSYGIKPVHRLILLNLSYANEYIGLFDMFSEKGADLLDLTSSGVNLIHFAVYNDDVPVEVIEYLIEKGIDINQQDNDGQTPLHIIHDEDYENMAWYEKSDSIQVRAEKLTLLLSKGADPNIKNNQGKTLAYYAVTYDYADIVHILHKSGGTLVDQALIDGYLKEEEKRFLMYDIEDALNVIILYILPILYLIISFIFSAFIFKDKREKNPLIYLNSFLSTLLLSITAVGVIAGIAGLILILSITSSSSGGWDGYGLAFAVAGIAVFFFTVSVIIGLLIGIILFVKKKDSILKSNKMYYIVPLAAAIIIPLLAHIHEWDIFF